MIIYSEKVTNFGSLINEHPYFIDGHDISSVAIRKNKQDLNKRHTGWHLAACLREIAIQAGLVDYASSGTEGWEAHETAAQATTNTATHIATAKATAKATPANIDRSWLDDTDLIEYGMPVGSQQLAAALLGGGKQIETKKHPAFQYTLEMLDGFAWEEWIVKRVPSISGTIWRPGQYGIPLDCTNHHEFVWCSPDGVSEKVKWLEDVYITHPSGKLEEAKSQHKGKVVTVGEEFKFTKKSRKRDIRQEWLWLHQIMGYAQPEVLDTLFWRLHVQYANGPYDKGMLGQAEYWRHWIEFTHHELANMRRILEVHISNTQRYANVWK